MKTIVFDFDGVIHSYKSGWKGITNIPDEPNWDVINLIKELSKDYKIVIVSSRASTDEGVTAIDSWLGKYGIAEYFDDITAMKVPAIAYVDDRAVPYAEDIEDMKKELNKFLK